VLVAAGLAASAAHAAAEAGVLTFGQASALNLTWLIAPGTIRASLITGMLGLQPTPTVIEVSLWLVYAIVMSLYVLWPQGRAPQQRRAPNVEPSPAAVSRSARNGRARLEGSAQPSITATHRRPRRRRDHVTCAR